MIVDPLSHLTNLNPLRGLSLRGLMVRLEQGERGDYAELQWMYRFVEKRDPTVRAIKKKLKGAIRGLDWKVKIPDNLSDERKAAAEEQKEILEEAYRRISNLKAAIVHLALADFRGYAHCNKIYRGAGAGEVAITDEAWDVTELRVVPQWHFSRCGTTTPWTYDPSARQGIAVGTPIDPSHWITHEEEEPASEIFAKCHVLSEMTDADWDGFLESYGDPAIFIIGPPNVAKEKELEYQSTAEQVVSSGRGYLPYGSTTDSVDPPSGHSEVFDNRLGYLQKLMVLAGTGGILSMLAEPTGIGKGASDSHDDTWLTIAAGVAADVSETLQAQMDKPELQRHYGPDVEVLAYFELERPKKSDPTGTATNAKAFRDAGYAIDADELSEESGYTLTPVAPTAETDAAAGGNATLSATTGKGAETVVQPGATAPITGAATGAAAAEPPGGQAAGSSQPPPEETAFLEKDPKLASNPRPSQTGDAKPSIVQSALAEAADVDAKTFAPIAPLLNAIEQLVKLNAPPEIIEAQIQATIDALPDVLGHLDPSIYADALEKALGPASVAGVRDAIAARGAGSAKKAT
ncbi:MAG TPA: DUF935 family protein [Chthoniobacter sp.]|nr:DUF935 family protein [Chthoniobacter sp.]